MNFELEPEQIKLREEVKAFISEHVTAEIRSELLDRNRTSDHGPLTAELFSEIANRGWMGVSWPAEYGGQDRGTVEQFIVESEFKRVGIHVGGGGTGAPAIMAAGTDEQKEEFVPGSISGEVLFCQGYSEPQAGTDLAGIQCRAERDGDEYVINGQKTWTTAAEVATHIYLLTRTSRDEKRRQAGITIFLVPMDTPGITVRPLWTIQSDPLPPPESIYAEPRVNEVFFDDVRVPRDCMLGEEGQGWTVGQRGLNLDRIGGWRHIISVVQDERMANLLAHTPDCPELAEDEVVRDKFGEMWIEAQLCRLMTMRSVSIQEAGSQFSYEGAAEKVWAPEHAVRATEAYAQFLGPHGQLTNGSDDALEDGFFAHNLLGAFQSTINHGSVQVMRDQIARHGLGLPRSR